MKKKTATRKAQAVKRRKKTIAGTAGYFANPTPKLPVSKKGNSWPSIVFLSFIQPVGGWGVLVGSIVIKAFDTYSNANNYIKTFYGK